MRKFWSIDLTDGTIGMEIFSKTPRDAALEKLRPVMKR